MSEETKRIPPASPKNKTTSARSASPKTDATRVRSASPRTDTSRVGSASPKNDSSRVQSASPRTDTAPVRSASPRTETSRVGSDSPKNDSSRVRSASPRTDTAPVRPASPRTETKRVRPASPRTEATQVVTSNGKAIPNYLRPSAGSCHDLCKHGTRHEHANDVKESRPWRKSVEGNGSDVMPNKENKTLTPAKKTNVVKPKPSSDPKVQPPSGETIDAPNEQTSSDATGELHASDGNEITPSSVGKAKQEISVPSNNVTVTEKEISSDAKDLKYSKKSNTISKVNPSSRSPSPISKGLSAERSIVGRKNVDGRKVFEGRKSPDQSGRRGLEMRKSPDGKKNTCMRTGVDTERTHTYDLNSSNAETNSEGSNNADDEYGTSLNPESYKKDGSLGNSNNDAESELLKKHIATSKPKIVKMKPLPSLYPSALKSPSPIHPSSGVRGSKSSDNQLPGKITTSRVDAKKVGTATKFPSSRSSVNREEITSTKKVGFIKLVSSSRRESKVSSAKEKDRNVQDAQEAAAEKESQGSTKVRGKSNITLLPPVLAVSKSTIKSRTSYMPPHLKKSSVGPQSKNTEKEASGLRKGNLVAIQSQNHGPSKPKVRKNPLPSITDQINKPSLRTRRDVTVHNNHDIMKNSNSSDRRLLKHPSIGRKKKTQVLFNKVIEETAKRLARTKKSNVLALVGAFETVISIQKKSSSAAARPKAKKISSFKKPPR